MSKDHEPKDVRPEETGKPSPVNRPNVDSPTTSSEPNGDEISGTENPKPPLPPTPPA